MYYVLLDLHLSNKTDSIYRAARYTKAEAKVEDEVATKKKERKKSALHGVPCYLDQAARAPASQPMGRTRRHAEAVIGGCHVINLLRQKEVSGFSAIVRLCWAELLLLLIFDTLCTP